MQYLVDSDLKIVYDAISQVKEPDRPAPEVEVEAQLAELLKWDRKKWETVESFIKRQRIEKSAVKR
jgi:hypothetical protein